MAWPSSSTTLFSQKFTRLALFRAAIVPSEWASTESSGLTLFPVAIGVPMLPPPPVKFAPVRWLLIAVGHVGGGQKMDTG